MTEQTIVRQYRLALGWTVEQTAQKIGVSSSTIFRWETGRSTPPKAAVMLLKMYAQKMKRKAEHGTEFNYL